MKQEELERTGSERRYLRRDLFGLHFILGFVTTFKLVSFIGIVLKH